MALGAEARSWPRYRIETDPISCRLTPDVWDLVRLDFDKHQDLTLITGSQKQAEPGLLGSVLAFSTLGVVDVSDCALVFQVGAHPKLSESDAAKEAVNVIQPHLPGLIQSYRTNLVAFGQEVVAKSVDDAKTLAKDSATAVVEAVPKLGFPIAAVVAAFALLMLVNVFRKA